MSLESAVLTNSGEQKTLPDTQELLARLSDAARCGYVGNTPTNAPGQTKCHKKENESMQHHDNYFTFQADTNYDLGLQLGNHFKEAAQVKLILTRFRDAFKLGQGQSADFIPSARSR